MARFEPLQATTYDPGRVVADDVIAPPYDVVSPAERAALARRSPYNAIHVELPADDSGSSVDRYEAAARLWGAWHEEGVVRVDSEAAFYLYRMTFRDQHGELRSTTGVLGALGLDPKHGGDVLPHEETTPKDKYDRLSLLRAARANFSPIWVLSVADGLAKACAEAVLEAGDGWSATDDEGVLHERWRLRGDTEEARRITELIADAPVLVADGHHRYETACTYLEERPGEPGADGVLALAVALTDEQLSVEAIHRVVRGVDPERFRRQLEKWFVVSAGPERSDDLALAMRAEGALGLVTAGGRWLLRPRPELEKAAGDDLDSARAAVALGDLGVSDVGYEHGVRRVSKMVEAQLAEAALLLRPVSVDQIARVAEGGRRMPPKTTFFRPKPRTGMVFRELAARL